MAKQAIVGKQAKTMTKRQAVFQPGFIEKHALKIAILLGVTGLIIRLYRLGFMSLWVDEYMHALAAIKGQFKHGENNGILLTWMDTICAYIFGHNEFAMRFPVALLGAALITATYVLGSHIANKKVGLMSAVFVTVSVYLIFWSRIDRPYGMVGASYIPLILCFWLMLEKKTQAEGFWKKIGIHPKYLMFTLLAFLLAMLSQLICFLFIFSAGFYGTLVAIENWFTKKSHPFRPDAYNLLFYLNVILVVLMLTPYGNNLMRPIIEIFLPGNMANLILPDLKAAFAALDTDKMYSSFDKYTGVLNTDFKTLAIAGWLGFILAFFKDRKLSYLLISAFVLPFLLMSFIFREPCHAKYLSYIYPVFLISAAYTLYFAAFHALKFVSKGFNEQNKSYLNACTIGFLVLTFAFTQRKEIANVLNSEDHGNQVDSKLAEVHFVNWKQPCEFIKTNMKPNDILMATVQFAPKFYLETDSVVWFRQMHYDALKKDYISNISDNKKISANTFEQLVKTYNQNPRGWLLADYYFDNALTDPQARQFVEQNFTYHFDASNDGGVKVFSWDKAKPKAYSSAFVIELGKNSNQLASQEFTMNINKASLPPKVYLFLLTQGIDSDNEAYIIINDNPSAIFIKQNGKSTLIEGNIVPVDPAMFRNGENKIQFGYNNEEGNGDLVKGCVIYNIDIR